MRIDSSSALGFVPQMRLSFALFTLACTAAAAVPPALDAALKNFRGEAPRGWSYTQTTTAEGKSTVERHDASKPEFERWSLVQKDGRAPTADELKDYSDARSRRSRTGTAPKLVDQLLLDTIETVAETPERVTYRFRVRPGESRDQTAAFLRATVVLHQPTGTLESFVLANVEPFAPTFGVKISELRTLMTYSLPGGDTPSLPQKVVTRVRGTAFWLKSLDAEMTVIFSDYTKAGRP
jgi:hypothetical protein